MADFNTSLLDDIELLNEPSSTTDNPFPAPVDPFEDYVNVTDYGSFEVEHGGNATERSNHYNIFQYLNYHPWLTYGLCALAGVIVIVAVIILICWLKKNKTRVITESSDPVLTSNYQDGAGGFSWCCCCKRRPKMGEQQRQNSSSNLEFYGRPPLPQSAYQTSRPASQESYHIEPSNMGMYIDGIEDIPNNDIPRTQHRELPKYRYQKYQV